MSMASPDPTPLEAKYPQTAQLCFSSHRRGGDGTGTDGVGGITICPEGYNFCIKEVIEDATEGECGKYKHNKDYFGDVYDLGQTQCTLRMCAKTCGPPEMPAVGLLKESAYTMSDGNREITRKQYCCGEKPGFREEPCNGSVRNEAINATFLLVLLVCLVLIR